MTYYTCCDTISPYYFEEMVYIIKYIIASKDEIELVIKMRLEMARAVHNLPSDYIFDDEFLRRTREYFEEKEQATVLALDKEVIGAATICYSTILPYVKNPTGKRGHIMSVYTIDEYRRQGIASQMLKILIDEAKKKGVFQITLDASNLGRPVYQKLSFVDSPTYMILDMYQPEQ